MVWFVCVCVCVCVSLLYQTHRFGSNYKQHNDVMRKGLCEREKKELIVAYKYSIVRSSELKSEVILK